MVVTITLPDRLQDTGRGKEGRKNDGVMPAATRSNSRIPSSSSSSGQVETTHTQQVTQVPLSRFPFLARSPRKKWQSLQKTTAAAAEIKGRTIITGSAVVYGERRRNEQGKQASKNNYHFLICAVITSNSKGKGKG